ncbi:MAG: hypothetical protein EBY45_01285 [Gammaproteobacteria bacterium]|nr:hypothetical protein [Gammaproteobacteria bacterium]
MFLSFETMLLPEHVSTATHWPLTSHVDNILHNANCDMQGELTINTIKLKGFISGIIADWPVAQTIIA